MTSQRPPITISLPPLGRNLNESFPNFFMIRGGGGSERVGSCANRKPIHDFRISLNTKFCSVFPCLSGIPMSSYAPSNSTTPPPVWGLDRPGKLKVYQSKCPPHIPIRTHYGPTSILRRLATIHNTTSAGLMAGTSPLSDGR